MAERRDQFTGFTPEAGGFLAELNAHNNRDWFAAHRDDYDRLLREPMQASDVLGTRVGYTVLLRPAVLSRARARRRRRG